MKILAHRGFSGNYPENTMLAFRKAVEAHADGIELDLHLSKDGELIIIHDELLERTTGKKGYVHDYLCKELQSIDAGIFSHDYQEETLIPSFSQYAHFIKDKDVITNIEIKTNRRYYPAIEEKILEALKAFSIEDKVIISSFNWLSVCRFKMIAPHIATAVLIEDTYVANIERQVASLAINFLHPDIHLLDDSIIESCNQAGVPLNIWTVNTEQQIKQAQQWGAQGIITNHPDLCWSLLNPPAPTL
ncbi:MAG: glycerophosphodiester phosphodiesterase [Sphaerochaeta sp.]